MNKKEKQEVIKKVIKFMEKKQKDDCSGHDWWHTWRVWQNAKYLTKFEKTDNFVVELGALLHDIADWKFYGGDMEKGSREAGKLLRRLQVDDKVIKKVAEIVGHISFKGEGVNPDPLSLEGQVVQDADKLDAVGAIAAARTFAFGGAMGRAIYDPEVPPAHFQNFKQYKNNHSSSINHFYEQHFLMKDFMNTKEARRIAVKREKVLRKFLDDFMDEWHGRDFK